MDIKTIPDAFTLSMVLAVTGKDKAKVKECKEMAEFLHLKCQEKR